MGSVSSPRKDAKSKSRRRLSTRWVSEVEVNEISSQSTVTQAQVFSASGMTVHHVRIDPKVGFDYYWKGRAHYVALHDLRNVDCETFSDVTTVDRRRDLRGRLTFIAAGCKIWGWSIPARSPQSFTAVYLDPQQMQIDVAKKLTNLPQASHLYFTNAALRSTLEKLQRGLTARTRPDAMYLESLALSAMLELCLFKQENIVAANPKGLLAKSLENRLADYVEAHLSSDIGLNDLAQIAGLSRYHFSRAFKLTTGQTPYHYLIERRIAMAQRLLRQATLPMSEIALAVGFKDATRLIRAFRRITGITPGVYRAS